VDGIRKLITDHINITTIYQHLSLSHISRNMLLNRRLENAGINTLNAELNPICYLWALLGAHHFLHVSRI